MDNNVLILEHPNVNGGRNSFDTIDVDLGDVNSRNIRNVHKKKTSKDFGDLGTGIGSR